MNGSWFRDNVWDSESNKNVFQFSAMFSDVVFVNYFLSDHTACSFWVEKVKFFEFVSIRKEPIENLH